MQVYRKVLTSFSHTGQVLVVGQSELLFEFGRESRWVGGQYRATHLRQFSLISFYFDGHKSIRPCKHLF